MGLTIDPVPKESGQTEATSGASSVDPASFIPTPTGNSGGNVAHKVEATLGVGQSQVGHNRKGSTDEQVAIGLVDIRGSRGVPVGVQEGPPDGQAANNLNEERPPEAETDSNDRQARVCDSVVNLDEEGKVSSRNVSSKAGSEENEPVDDPVEGGEDVGAVVLHPDLIGLHQGVEVVNRGIGEPKLQRDGKADKQRVLELGEGSVLLGDNVGHVGDVSSDEADEGELQSISGSTLPEELVPQSGRGAIGALVASRLGVDRVVGLGVGRRLLGPSGVSRAVQTLGFALSVLERVALRR